MKTRAHQFPKISEVFSLLRFSETAAAPSYLPIPHYNYLIPLCSPALENNEAPLPHSGYTFRHRGLSLLHLQNALLYIKDAMQQGGVALRHCKATFRNCKFSFPKLRAAIRYWNIPLPNYQLILPHCNHSPPFPSTSSRL